MTKLLNKFWCFVFGHKVAVFESPSRLTFYGAEDKGWHTQCLRCKKILSKTRYESEDPPVHFNCRCQIVDIKNE